MLPNCVSGRCGGRAEPGELLINPATNDVVPWIQTRSSDLADGLVSHEVLLP